MNSISIPVKDIIIPMYDDILEDILSHKHLRYIFKGGRGSTKSSFVGGIAVPLLIMLYPNIHAVCFRKVANTIQNSIFAQVVWGIYQLGVDSLFQIPKHYNTPIVYKPTGQQIIFMGLDDPNKVKSIKLPFGYIGITWCEELDQFAGPNEIRKVTQSTMRGGDLFWDFRTFNPPISLNNWANEYVASIQDRDNTLIVHNTYLDVPKEWLGPVFFEEANELKEINPKAYEHEYLGIPVGTGGNVFQNVEDLDMRQLITIPGTTEKIRMVDTFDKIFNGIDWGFANDPFRFVKMHFDKRHLDLYIFAELDSHQTRNITIFEELYDTKKLIDRTELVIADSAEPKSIADFKAYGAYIRGAVKGPDSVRYGIKWLQGLRHIYIDRRYCPKTFQEFVAYEYEQDRDGNFISAYPDENNHGIDACLPGYAEIYTPDGYKTIESLVNTTGKLYGYDTDSKEVVITDYINCRMTFEEAEIWEIELEDGRIIECTYNHRILTSNRGYVMACELNEQDDVMCIDSISAVMQIQKTDKKIPVYDLEVPKTHNFILKNGVVVHNCRYGLEKFYSRRGN